MQADASYVILLVLSTSLELISRLLLSLWEGRAIGEHTVAVSIVALVRSLRSAC
jgi:DNA-binding winged helix-turn-helix (wHTH) protein